MPFMRIAVAGQGTAVDGGKRYPSVTTSCSTCYPQPGNHVLQSATRNAERGTRNVKPATSHSQPATHNLQPASRKGNLPTATGNLASWP